MPYSESPYLPGILRHASTAFCYLCSYFGSHLRLLARTSQGGGSSRSAAIAALYSEEFHVFSLLSFHIYYKIINKYYVLHINNNIPICQSFYIPDFICIFRHIIFKNKINITFLRLILSKYYIFYSYFTHFCSDKMQRKCIFKVFIH